MPTQTDLDNALNSLKQTIADTAARVLTKLAALEGSGFTAELDSIRQDMEALQAIAPDAPTAQADKTGGFDQPVAPGVASKNLRETGDPLTPADPNAAQTADVSSSSTALPGKTAAQGDVAAANTATTTSGSAPGNSATTAGGGFAVDANGSPADSDGTGEEAGSEQAGGTAASITTATGDK